MSTICVIEDATENVVELCTNKLSSYTRVQLIATGDMGLITQSSTDSRVITAEKLRYRHNISKSKPRLRRVIRPIGLSYGIRFDNGTYSWHLSTEFKVVTQMPTSTLDHTENTRQNLVEVGTPTIPVWATYDVNYKYIALLSSSIEDWILSSFGDVAHQYSITQIDPTEFAMELDIANFRAQQNLPSNGANMKRFGKFVHAERDVYRVVVDDVTLHFVDRTDILC